jgi:hypothetical protein
MTEPEPPSLLKALYPGVFAAEPGPPEPPPVSSDARPDAPPRGGFLVRARARVLRSSRGLPRGRARTRAVRAPLLPPVRARAPAVAAGRALRPRHLAGVLAHGAPGGPRVATRLVRKYPY